MSKALKKKKVLRSTTTKEVQPMSRDTAKSTEETYLDRMARKEDLEARKAALSPEVNKASSERNKWQLVADECHKQVISFRSEVNERMKRDGRDVMAPDERARIEELQEAFRSASEQLEEAEKRYTAMDAELTSLENQVRQFNCKVVADDVLSFQAILRDVARRAEDLRALIAMHERTISEERASMPAVPDMREQREDLLAEIAEGTATDADLKKLDQEIAKAQRAAEEAREKIQTVIDKEEALVSAFRRRLSSIEADLTAREERNRKVIIEFFVTSLEEAGEEYDEALLRLAETYRKVMAIADLLGRYDKDRPTVVRSGLLDIPHLIRTTRETGDSAPNHEELLWRVRNAITVEAIGQQMTTESARLSALGIEL